MRWVSVRVLPVPGPATTSSGPPGADAATRCIASSRSSSPVPTSSMPASIGSHGRCGEARRRDRRRRRLAASALAGVRGRGLAPARRGVAAGTGGRQVEQRVRRCGREPSSPGSKSRITPYSPS